MKIVRQIGEVINSSIIFWKMNWVNANLMKCRAVLACGLSVHVDGIVDEEGVGFVEGNVIAEVDTAEEFPSIVAFFRLSSSNPTFTSSSAVSIHCSGLPI